MDEDVLRYGISISQRDYSLGNVLVSSQLHREDYICLFRPTSEP